MGVYVDVDIDVGGDMYVDVYDYMLMLLCVLTLMWMMGC